MNPNRNILQDEHGEYTLFFDGNVMSTGHNLDDIIPILRAGKLLLKWHGIVNPDAHEQNYLCSRGPFKHVCDNTMTRKLIYNNEFDTCKKQTIKVPTEPCNLLTDEVSVETLDETCDLPPNVFKE